MTTILPAARSPWHVIDQAIGQQLSQNLPDAVQRGFERQRGLNAIDQLQSELATAGGDINKMLPALARAYTLNPNLERSGLGQTFMQQAKVGRAYPGAAPGMGGGVPNQPNQPVQQEPTSGTQQTPPGAFPTPSPFNIFTKDQMDAEAQRWANAVQDPNGYNIRYNQLEAQNATATNQRKELEDAALKANVDPKDLPRFMVVNSHLDPTNPSKWAQEGIRNFGKVKSADTSLERAFIPGLGSGLLGRDRAKNLKNLENDVQEKVKAGLEQETREFLADNYLTPTEIESLIHPVTPQIQKSIEKLPKGLFPAQTQQPFLPGTTLRKEQPKSPFISYEEALERDPQSIQRLNSQLADFFLKNVNDNTSLLPLRYDIWKNKDYDWRQFGPAIKEAMEKGLKLNPRQQAELTDINTQAPYESLPEIFQDFDRVVKFLRGNK